jgi:hypothetical protein
MIHSTRLTSTAEILVPHTGTRYSTWYQVEQDRYKHQVQVPGIGILPGTVPVQYYRRRELRHLHDSPLNRTPRFKMLPVYRTMYSILSTGTVRVHGCQVPGLPSVAVLAFQVQYYSHSSTDQTLVLQSGSCRYRSQKRTYRKSQQNQRTEATRSNQHQPPSIDHASSKQSEKGVV